VRRTKCFRLVAQDVRFQPVVQVQVQLLVGPGRHPVTVLIEPRLGVAQPAPRLLGLPEALLVGAGTDSSRNSTVPCYSSKRRGLSFSSHHMCWQARAKVKRGRGVWNLTDALEEAGVGTDLLAHLRGPGPHLRGCWVVDLLAGRS
jgi:hypothetical protein